MSKTSRPSNATFDVDALWALDRIGAPSLSPDGAQAVAAVTRHSMETNKAQSSLWLFSTLGGEPRRLTAAGDKDGHPQWSPRGDLIAFTAKREQGGQKDDEPQLYVIAPDGGEARRVGQVPTGVEAFKWFPDGRRIAFVSWVWPDRKAAAQADALKDFKARKETAYVTDEALYRFWDHHIPMGRVPHLHVMDVDSGKARDLFEGSDLELSRAEPDADCFDVSPDGRRIAFVFDPEADKRLDNRYALAEIDVKTRHAQLLLRDADWHFGAPRYSHAGGHLAFLASHQALGHNRPDQLAVLDQHGRWAVFSDGWDHEVTAPLRWAEDDQAVLFAAEQRGRRHIWRFALGDSAAEVVFEGGHVAAFAQEAGFTVINHDSVQFPPRLSVLDEGAPRRIEALNDARLAAHTFGRHEEVTITGARGDDVQMWLIYPPGFDAKKKWPVMHVIHGGPHTAFGDSWHWRWNHQAFAAQGYVVACVNYHGSSSFGHEFLDSITGRWGEYELQDVEAGTEWLLKKPWVNKKRIVATGGSYGGYMVAWMNGHVKPGRYQAYVCHAGCYDWQAMYADDAYSWHRKELGAAYWDDPARIAAQSPHAFAANFATPTLVIHGAMDYRVPDAQGLAYYNTLKSLGVPARLVWFPDENHWVLKPRNSRLWYGEFFAWLKQHAA
ncbi:S9 family peptidase [Roseateles asaccharophilus]|uniref:Dipeptidyl aminopeptidase/acylaminoacyl peptidase n=1 Tax=Roseateles asaccharophilus TaxID=582607 RepID=A0ABU2AFP8_9BURK|nr:S9 family peptidase [Roseateles asaccharophilus]MDR7336034.1 dipeptidyl aminopeptidase/acylaminoacyl peptidase [Roseateles asaccharophilus]